MDLLSLSGAALISFGGVWVLNVVYRRFQKTTPPVDFQPDIKFAIAVVIAFIWLLVPKEFGNFVADTLRNAIGIATGVAGGYQFFGGVAKKIGA